MRKDLTEGAAVNDRPVLTAREVATLLGLTPATVYRAMSRGEIPSISLGRRKLIPVAMLKRLLAGENT